MFRALVIAGFFVCMSSGASAQVEKQDGGDITKAFSRTYHDCQIYGETHNTIARTDCSDKELEFQDGRLNVTWKVVMGRLPATRKTDLRSDQRNWIVARDALCAEAAEYDKADCLSYETIKRIRYLNRIK